MKQNGQSFFVALVLSAVFVSHASAYAPAEIEELSKPERTILTQLVSQDAKEFKLR